MIPRETWMGLLLNRLPEPEREELLDRILSEEGFAETLEVAERELLDAYVRNRLPAAVRKEVEAELFFNEQQQVKLLVAKALARKDRKMAVPARFLAIAAMLLIIAAAAIYFSFVRRTQVTPLKQVASVQHSSSNPSPSRHLVAVLLLSPGLTRGTGIPALHLEPRFSAVRLDLELPSGFPRDAVAVSLTDSSHSKIWSAAAVTPSTDGLSVQVPADVFRPGTFQIRVEATPLTYYFKVR